jgi:SAM-dependent methyltransferase
MSKGHFAGVSYHLRMLGDRVRTDAFRRALEALVRPGDVVVDVGAGTGILSLFAARAGAAKVYAIESTPMARIARQIVAENGLSHIIEVIEADARTVALPEPADLLVSECLGTFAYSDAMFNVLADCRRLLKPGARICPARVDVFLAPAVVKPFLGDIQGWDELDWGFSMGAARHSAENDLHCVDLPAGCLRGEPALLHSFALTEAVTTHEREVHWRFDRAAVIDGIAGWFLAELAPGIALDTAPGVVTHWGQVVFPIPATEVDPGDGLSLRFRTELSLEDLPGYHWRGAFLDPHGAPVVPFDQGQDLRFGPSPGPCFHMGHPLHAVEGGVGVEDA